MSNTFSEEILTDKLSKLNSTQQCIETLSHWCIFHRSKAEQVVETWNKQFHKVEAVKKVPLLYLANDILQNSKRNGNEFVTEFWKVLPSAVKEINEKGNDHGKTAISRLIKIWEERKVFGSRAQSLKDVMLGEELPGPLEIGKKRSHSSVRIVKRDSRSIRTKLTIGGTAEKIVSAFDIVLGDRQSEAEEMSKCKTVVHRVRKMEKDVEMALKISKDPKRKSLAKELEGEENHLKQCIEKLKVVEANRVALVSQLQEALQEQESELENIRTQMQVAQAQAEEAGNMRKHLDDESYVTDQKNSNATTNSNATQPTKKTAAAEVADKLAASSSSQYIMASVLSTFAAEAAKNVTQTQSPAVSTSFSLPPINSAPMQPMNPYQLQQPSMQNQVFNPQPQYHSIPNPPGGMMNSFHYANVPPPPPPPAPLPPSTPSYIMSSMVPMNQQQGHMSQHQMMTMGIPPPIPTQQQLAPLPQQPPAHPTFQPGMVYYPHPHHPQ